MWQSSKYKFEPGSSKIWTLPFGFYHIFSNFKNPLDSIFEPGSVSCTHYTFPNAKDYMSTKFYDKLKIGVYVNRPLNNYL
jgi:hypothetical protein